MSTASQPDSSSAQGSSHAPRSSPARLSAWTAWLLVATLTLLCLWLHQLYDTARAENAVLRDQQQLTALELRDARQHAEAERILAQRELAELRRKLDAR